MKSKKMHCLVLLIITNLLFCQAAVAGLLISPLRIAFEDRERADTIVLINSGSETRTYRLEWEQKKALAAGGYELLTESEAKTFNTASQMIRFSPKQVTLKPNERQTVRLSVRRPKGLEDGEYRSHLLFKQLPIKSNEFSGKGQGIQLDVMLSYSLPIIVRQGVRKADVEITDVNVANKADSTNIELDFKRTGASSTIGNVIVLWQALGMEKEVEVSRLNHVKFYHELSDTHLSLPWRGDNQISGMSGVLRVIYRGLEEYNGRTFVEKTVNISDR